MVEHGEKPHLQPLGIIRRGPKTQHYTAPPLPAFYHALISRLRIFEAQRAHTVRYDNEPDPAEEIPAILAAEAFYGLLEPNDAAATADYLRGRDADLLADNATQRQRAADTLDKRLHTWQRQLRHAHSTPLASAGIPIDSAENYRLAFLRAVKLEAGADAPTAARRIADLIAVSPRRATTITRRAGFDVTPNFVEQTTTAADYRQAETVRGARPVSLRVDLPAYSEEIPYAYAGQELQAIPADTRVTVRLQAMNTHADNGNPRPYEKHKPNRQSAEPPRQEEPMPTPNRQPAKPEAEPAQAAPAIAIAPPDMNCRGYLREWTLGQLRLRLKARGFDDNRASGRMTRRAVIDPETGEVLTPAQAVPRSDAIALINALAGFELIAQTADGPHVDTLAAADPLLAVAREFGADIRRVA